MRRRLILLALAAFIPLFALTAALAVIYLRQQHEAMRQDALRTAADLMDRVEEELQSQIQLLEVLAQSPILDDAQPDLQRFHMLASRFPENLSTWHTVILVSPDGRQLLNSRLPYGTPLPPINDQAGHRKLMETRRPVVGNLVGPGPLAPDNVPKAGLRVPVVRDGEVVFDLVAVISLDRLALLLSAPDLPLPFQAWLIDGGGTLASAPRTPERVGRPATATSLAARQQSHAGIYELDVMEEQLVTAFRRSEWTGWSAHVGIPEAVYYAPLQRAQWAVGGSAAVALGLTALFAFQFRRQMRLDRQTAQFQERALRMEALGRMTGGVAHDFNNLLMVILSGLEMIRRKTVDKGVERYVVEIRKAAERAAHLTRELTAFSRGTPSKTTVIDLNARVRDVLTMIQRTIGDSIVTRLDLVDRPLPVEVDVIQLDLALLNLAANARDAMPSGGTLTISTRLADFPDRSGRSGVLLCVIDTGSGIDEDAVPHVFEPFFTTKGIGKGTGLGLSQVYNFASSSGGLADIDSRIGKGTTVRIYLPESNAAIATPSRESAAPGSGLLDGQTRTVLLVEDSAQVRSMIAGHLAELGLAVREAANADEALAILEHGTVDVLLSDLSMPGAMDGYALAKTVRGRWPEIDVILMSGYSQSIAAAAGDGFQVLAKPFELNVLVKALDKAASVKAG